MKTLVTNLANNQVMISYRDEKTGALTGDTEFHSYGIKIADNKNGKIYLDSDKWNYSKTTIKYLCDYLGYRGKKNIEDAIKNGIMILTDLNK